MLAGMAVREILQMGDDRLLRQAQAVNNFGTDTLHALVQDMLDTMVAANGAGLAAPQIGVNLQVIIFGSDRPNPRYPDAPLVPRTVLCNPVITPLGERALVPRWQCIRYTGFDQHGKVIDRTVEGFHARVVQHEYDHLIGVLYPMRLGQR
jgi:peptide deformylase